MKKVWSVIEQIFGISVFVNGLLNVFIGNDPLIGSLLAFISVIYISTTKAMLKKDFGLSVHYIVKIILGILIVWLSIFVGALPDIYRFQLS